MLLNGANSFRCNAINPTKASVQAKHAAFAKKFSPPARTRAAGAAQHCCCLVLRSPTIKTMAQTSASSAALPR